MSFSCLISCYKNDSPRYLEECLFSLSEQTLLPGEVIFVEDGPLTSELYDVIEKYRQILKIKCIRIRENVGLGKALNIGLRECTYELVLRMDTDDIAHKDRFSSQIDFLRNNPEVDIVGTWAQDISEDNVVIRERKYPINNLDIRKLIWANPLIHPSIAYRKSRILELGSYSEVLRRRQDYDLWLRAAKANFRFHNIPEFLLNYRFTDDYYKKNDKKVAFSQSVMGFNGIKGNKDVPLSAYVLVWGPWIKTLLPDFLMKKLHKIMFHIDPRSSNLNK